MPYNPDYISQAPRKRTTSSEPEARPARGYIRGLPVPVHGIWDKRGERRASGLDTFRLEEEEEEEEVGEEEVQAEQLSQGKPRHWDK